MTPMQGIMRGVQDAFLLKLTPAGNSLVYSTFLGGTGEDNGFRVAGTCAGFAIRVRITKSTDFPVQNAVQTASGGGFDVFVAKFTPAGDALVYSTYLGGNQDDFGFGNMLLTRRHGLYQRLYEIPQFLQLAIRCKVLTTEVAFTTPSSLGLSPQGNGLLTRLYRRLGRGRGLWPCGGSAGAGRRGRAHILAEFAATDGEFSSEGAGVRYFHRQGVG